MNRQLFESIPDRRNTHSLKWGKYDGSDIIPLWVADMDFKSPPEVINAAVKAAEFGNFGYSHTPHTLVDILLQRFKDIYHWEIQKNWIIWLPGMVCGLNVCCRALEKDSSRVFTQVPIYPPFLSAPGNFGLSSKKIPMKLENHRFSFDFDALEMLDTSPGDLFMLCHPHNPVGTAYTRGELLQFSEWIVSRNLYLCSDEIHCDLILDSESKHFPIANISPELAKRTITLMAPSKTFNLPGFGCSFAIISETRLRVKFKQACLGIVPDPPAMGFVLAEAAYRHGEPWRQELLQYLTQNRDDAFKELSRMPFLVPYSPQATYLLWIDARELPVDNPHKYFEENGVGLSDGKEFGSPGFLRLNLGCSNQLLQEALERMNKACKALS